MSLCKNEKSYIIEEGPKDIKMAVIGASCSYFSIKCDKPYIKVRYWQ